MTIAMTHSELRADDLRLRPLDPRKFVDPDRTLSGEARAAVDFVGLETLWFNTGTLCNLTCSNCYIESSPTNDQLAYLSLDDVRTYLDEIRSRGWHVPEIAFTGGEPFLNRDLVAMIRLALDYGHRVLVLTNAMRPMMIRADDLLAVRAEHGDRLILRVSLDHHTRRVHEAERGPRTWDPAIAGLRWLAENGFNLRVAGRTFTDESESALRREFARLFAELGIAIDANDPVALVLFPEMDTTRDVPEITTSCWSKLDVDPAAMMCATSRMVVRRKGAARPVVLPCTLIPYDAAFEMGETLAGARSTVKLNHPHCASFCVLGGGSCSVPYRSG
jgi:uncharacterized Fe-S cluster-containing radical SAM superfamily protein